MKKLIQYIDGMNSHWRARQCTEIRKTNQIKWIEAIKEYMFVKKQLKNIHNKTTTATIYDKVCGAR